MIFATVVTTVPSAIRILTNVWRRICVNNGIITHQNPQFVSGSSWCVTQVINGVESPYSNTITFP